MKPKIFLLIISSAFYFTACSNDNDKNKIEASGTIEATNVIISAKVGGQVEKIYKDEGDKVKVNDTLLIIDHELLRIQLEQAMAGNDFAQAQLNLLRTGARKEDINQTSELLKQAEINYKQAERDFERMKSLYDSKSITKKQFEDAQAKMETLEAQYNAAKENLQKITNFARPEELKQAEANLRKAASSVDLLKKNIKDSYVIAPVGGFIVEKFIEKGETVVPSSSLLKISDLNIVDLVIYVSEEELGKVKLGQKAEVTIDAYENKVYEGKVIYISPEAEFTPKNIQTKDERTKLVFAVKIQINNPEFDLKPGMPADAVIDSEK